MIDVLTPCCGITVQVEPWEFSATSVEVPTPCDCSVAYASTVRVSAIRQPQADRLRHKDGLVTFG